MGTKIEFKWRMLKVNGNCKLRMISKVLT